MLVGGFGIPKDCNQALDWFKKAAAHGNIDATAKVGILCYTGGPGLKRSPAEAPNWLLKASDVPAAQFWLGQCYEHGLGVKRDPRLAVDWFHKAAENGDDQAQYKLGTLYACGRKGEVEKSLAQMYLWLSLSAAQGNITAIHDLPIMKNQALPSDIADGEKLLAGYRSRHPSPQASPAPACTERDQSN
jgi:TPR repeat protein